MNYVHSYTYNIIVNSSENKHQYSQEGMSCHTLWPLKQESLQQNLHCMVTMTIITEYCYCGSNLQVKLFLLAVYTLLTGRTVHNWIIIILVMN